MLVERRLLDPSDVSITKYDEHNLIDMYHNFMKFYHCWIPLKEFIELPISLTLSLWNRIIADKKKIKPQLVIIGGYAKKSFMDNTLMRGGVRG